MSTRTLPVGFTVALLVVAVVAPAFAGVAAADGELAVAVDQDASTGDVTVSVTNNGTAVANASVAVDAPNASYAGEGTHTTGPNGTVALPAPERNVSVTVAATKGNLSGTATAELTVADDGEEFATFGQRVAAFVDWLHGAMADPSGGLVAEFVLANNPAAERIPDHAGPGGTGPGDAGNASQGPPDDRAGNASAGNESTGPGAGNGPGDDGRGYGNGPGNGPGGNGNGYGNDAALGRAW